MWSFHIAVNDLLSKTDMQLSTSQDLTANNNFLTDNMNYNFSNIILVLYE